jgi:DNA-binding PadR family transcriptional regulator
MRVPKRRKVGNLLALAVLSYLSQRPLHPYELGRTLREHGDARSIKFNHGSLYMVFQQLAKAGLIVEHETSRAGQRPERTVYAITDDGRRELKDWMRELVEEPNHEYPHFVAALSLIAALPPDEVVDLLRTRARRLAEQRAETRALIDETLALGVHPLFLIEEDYRVALLDAEMEFVQQFIGQINHPTTGWARPWAEFQAAPVTTDETEQK